MAARRESLEQRAYIEWAQFHPYARRVFAIPNGGKRSPVEAAIMKAEGVTPGASDLFLPCARGGAHGLFIEMKWGDNKPTAEQEAFAASMIEVGYAVAFCWGCSAAIAATTLYLKSYMKPGRYEFTPEHGAEVLRQKALGLPSGIGRRRARRDQAADATPPSSEPG